MKRFYVIFYDDDGRLTVSNKIWDIWSDADAYRESIATCRRPVVVTDADEFSD